MNDTSKATASHGKGQQTSTDAEQVQEHKEDALDEALEESFPASDPVAVSVEKSEKKPG